MELTPGRVVEFCNEATLLNSLQHDNIVHCHGVAIMPPAISLVRLKKCSNVLRLHILIYFFYFVGDGVLYIRFTIRLPPFNGLDGYRRAPVSKRPVMDYR